MFRFPLLFVLALLLQSPVCSSGWSLVRGDVQGLTPQPAKAKKFAPKQAGNVPAPAEKQVAQNGAAAKQEAVKEAKGGDAKEVKKQEGAEDEKAAEATKEAAEEKKATPIGDLIRGIFGGRKQQPAIPADEEGHDHGEDASEEAVANEGEEKQKQLDKNLNSLSEVSLHLRRIELRIPQGRWPDVVKGLHDVLELSEDTFTRDPSGNDWMSAKRRAEQMLGGLPSDGKRAYVASYGELAADMLAKGAEAGDLDQVAEVAQQFFHTPAGQSAAMVLAEVLLDRGEYAGAARWLAQLEASGASVMKEPGWRVRYADALVQSGQSREARRFLSDTPDMRPLLGDITSTEPITPRDWIAKLESAGSRQTPAVANWTGPLGTASHHALAIGEEPLLLQRWHTPITNLASVADQVGTLVTDLTDAGRVCIPASSPIVVNGLVAARTLSGVVVVELATGQVLWQTTDNGSPDDMLTIQSGKSATNHQMRAQILMQSRYSNNGDFDNHPLTNWLFNDATSGTLSTDSRSLFVLEQNAVFGQPNYNSGWNMQQNVQTDPFDRDWASNRIVAYDLRSGRPRWEVGGRLMNEPFDPRLAGVYFLGPPIASGSELFVIGEKDNSISLYVLDGATGEPMWSQALANSSTDIQADHVRRCWACCPAVSDGAVICPTGSGWLASVDRQSRRLLWAHRYSKPQDSNQRRWGGYNNNQPLPLNTRWAVTPPIVVQNRVLYTPPDLPDPYQSQQPPLLCLNATTGEQEWTRNKEEDLYLAGVVGPHALLVGKQHVRSVSIENGTVSWTTPIASDARPSGRGLVIGENFALPLTNGDLLSLSVGDGKLTTRFSLPEGSRQLGNLLAHQGAILSIDVEGVRCFEQRQTIEAQIAQRRQANPADPWALVKEAQIQLLRNDSAAAIACLEGFPLNDPNTDPQTVQQRHLVLKRALLARIQSDLKGFDQEFQQLSTIPGATGEFEYRQVAIDRALVRGEHRDAFGQLWGAVDGSYSGEWIFSQQLRVRRDVWLGGRLHDLYLVADEAVQQEMTAQFELAVRAAIDGQDLQKQRVLERMLAFHPVGLRLSHKLAVIAGEADDFAGAEIRWRQLLDSPNQELVAESVAHLAELLAKHGQLAEAASLLDGNLALHGETLLLSGERLIDRANEIRATHQLEAVAPPSSADALWGDQKLAISTTRGYYQHREQLGVSPFPGDSPFYKSHAFVLERNVQRLRILDPSRNDEFWSVPLRVSQRGGFDDRSMSIRTIGTQAFLMSRDIVHALSLPERRVLWTMPIELRASSSMYVRNAVPNDDQQQMQAASQFLSAHSLGSFYTNGTSTGMLAAVTPRAVVVHGRLEFSVLDPLSGDVLWTRKNVPVQSMVYGDSDRLYVIPGDGGKSYALRVSDGQQIANATFEKNARQSIAMQNGQLVTFSQQTRNSLFGLGRQTVEIQSLNLEDGAESWKFSFDGRSLLNWATPTELAILEQDGSLQVVNVVSGKATRLGVLPKELMESKQSLQVVNDTRFLYLLVDDGRARNYYQPGFPALRMHGHIACFDREQNKLAWNVEVGGQYLLRNSMSQLPGLLLMNMRHVNEDGVSIMYLQAKLLDKQTGSVLVDSGEMVSQNQFNSFRLDLAKPQALLTAGNLHVQIHPAVTATSVAPDEPTSPPVPAAVPDNIGTTSEDSAPTPDPLPDSPDPVAKP